MIRVGLIGAGHWGPNIARCFELSGNVELRWLCDLDSSRLERIAAKYPRASSARDVQTVLDDDDVEAVAISTPAATHYEIARKALLAGKHVLVEKPITTDSQQALELIRLAKQQQRILMVGHVFEYNSTVRALKDLIDSGELGEIYYLNFERTNLGPVRTDVNALWDLASHDVSIMCYLLGRAPTEVTARGRAFLNGGIEDTVFATFDFGTTLAHLHSSWLNPRKVREITAVGGKKMAVWNDLDVQHPIRIYDKRIVDPEGLSDSYHAYKTAVVDGGVHIPHTECNQPLQAECDHFIECIEHGVRPLSDGYAGLRVLSALEAATTSMRSHGEKVAIQMPSGEDDETSASATSRRYAPMSVSESLAG